VAPWTMFTWGYWGWGTTTRQFVQAADAVEASRGFNPPLFVDIRIRRSVRAPGFTGAAFERTVGEARHRWMPSLGNRAVRDGRPGIEIDAPSAAEELLDLALEHGERRHRVLFFCSCEYPGLEHAGGCHRTAVARLLLEASARRNQPVEIVEWPGGDPLQDLAITVSHDVARKVARGNRSIVLGDSIPLKRAASIPWYSEVSISARSDDSRPLRLFTGPARFSAGMGWWLPRLDDVDPLMSSLNLSDFVRQKRAERGFDPRRSGQGPNV
jgi:hypothetical protein